MNATTRQTITYSAQLIWALWKQELRPDIEPPFCTALALLDEIEDEALGLEELADRLQLHPSTISEYIAALQQGGIKIEVSSDRTHNQHIGRKEARYKMLRK